MYIKKCPACEKEFKTSSIAAVYCNYDCYLLGHAKKMIDVECCNCHKILSINEKIITNKPNKKIYCSNECRSEYRKNNPIIKIKEIGKCEVCSESFYQSDYRIKRFCSNVCANIFQGRNKVILKCKICGVIFKVSPTNAREHPENNKRFKQRYCSLKCRDADPEKNFGITGNLAQQNQKGPNKLEIAGKQILKSIQKEIKFTIKEQKPIANKFIVDVFIPKFNLIIQWDGDYWHGNIDTLKTAELTSKQIRRRHLDESQNKYFLKCGYKILRFWESEVKNNPQKVKSDIMNIMKENVK